ncbi:MAG: hypothetical protein K6A44_08185 [bacterium]|nr:hypothetical protein [bacterium]
MNISPISNKNYINTQQQSFNGIVPKFVAAGYDRFTDGLAKGMGKIIDTKTVQNFADKFHDTNIATHIFSATGILLSSFFILSTAKSKKIEEERKKPLMMNTAISCAIATVGGYTIDNVLNKPIKKFIENFKTVNANSPKLHKYEAGIKIAKSALIFGMLYRFVVPVISMFLAEKVVEKPNKKLNKKA